MSAPQPSPSQALDDLRTRCGLWAARARERQARKAWAEAVLAHAQASGRIRSWWAGLRVEAALRTLHRRIAETSRRDEAAWRLFYEQRRARDVLRGADLREAAERAREGA